MELKDYYVRFIAYDFIVVTSLVVTGYSIALKLYVFATIFAILGLYIHKKLIILMKQKYHSEHEILLKDSEVSLNGKPDKSP